MKSISLYEQNSDSFYTRAGSAYSYQNAVRLKYRVSYIKSLNAELNPICHLLALLGTHRILYVSRIRVKRINKS